MSLIVVIAAVAMWFGKLNLRVLFAVLILAMWLTLATIHNLLSYVVHENGAKMRSRVKFVLTPLHLAFAILLFSGVFGGATCSKTSTYPFIFYLSGVLFIILFVVVVNMNMLDFLLTDSTGEINDQFDNKMRSATIGK